MGGPLGVGYMLYTNYQSVSATKKANNFWIYPVLIYIALKFVAYLYPEDTSSQNYFLSAMYLLATILYYNNVHSKLIKPYIAKGGKAQHWGMVALISLAGGALTPWSLVSIKIW